MGWEGKEREEKEGELYMKSTKVSFGEETALIYRNKFRKVTNR